MCECLNQIINNKGKLLLLTSKANRLRVFCFHGRMMREGIKRERDFTFFFIV